MSSASSSTVTAYNSHRHPPVPSVIRAKLTPIPSKIPLVPPPPPSSTYSSSLTDHTAEPPSSPIGEDASKKNRTSITPAVLRNIFASSRSLLEERTISRVAFFRFAGFLLSCLGISLFAARGRPVHALGLGGSR